MAHYLIEFRFQSRKIRSYLEEIIYGINRKFRVGKRRHIPHITLIGPITTNNEQRMIADFARVCSETKVMNFRGQGFGTFDSNRVVYVNIGATEGLNDFRTKLVELLRVYCKLQQQDKRKDIDKFGYHSTLAMNLNPSQFNSIKQHIRSKAPPKFNQIIMRITLLKNGKILREYDFMQRRLLNRRQALNRKILGRSKFLLQQYLKGQYNSPMRISQQHRAKPQTESFLNKILSFFTGK